MRNIPMILFLLLSLNLFSQEQKDYAPHTFSVDYLYGSVLEHNPDIAHLITRNSHAFLFSWNKKTFGTEEWSARYNYPDQGISLLYQDMGDKRLGDNISLMVHMNFYFLNRNLVLKVGQGITYNTKPYHRETNFYNNAYGSHLLAGTLFMGNYVNENLFGSFGLKVGFALMHYSNGNVKAPNIGTNNFSVNLGLIYHPDYQIQPDYEPKITEPYSEPVHFNFALRGGVHSSKVIRMKSRPFMVLAAYADKRVSYKSSFQAGTEYFYSYMLKDFLKYRAIAYPNDGFSGEESSARLGVFVGYMLHINEFSLFGNAGYYIYYPVDYFRRNYLRAGIQYNLNEDWFANVSIHSHWAKAESVSLTLGYRL